MKQVFYHPKKLQEFLAQQHALSPKDIIAIDREPEQYGASQRRKQRSYLRALFCLVFVLPENKQTDMSRLQRFFFFLSRRLFTRLYPSFTYQSSMQIIQDYLSSHKEKEKKERPTSSAWNPSKEWAKALKEGAKQLRDRYQLSQRETWETIVSEYHPHAPFTDVTAIQLLQKYKQSLTDPSEQEKIERAIEELRAE